MKRFFLMKAFVCLFTVVALCSCNKDEDDENGNVQVPDNTFIAVENGASYNGKIDVVKAEIYTENNGDYITLASAPYENGGFTIDLPESVNVQYLESMDNIPQGLTVSNPNAKIGMVDLNAYKSDTVTGQFYYGITHWEGIIAYFDSDLSITGSYTLTDKKVYNVHGKKGWNMVYIIEYIAENNIESFTEITTQSPPKKLSFSWHFQEWSYFLKGKEPSVITKHINND
jgi:hypothetical protein